MFQKFLTIFGNTRLKNCFSDKIPKMIVNINKHCNFMKLIPGNLYFLCDRPMGKIFWMGVETLKGQMLKGLDPLRQAVYSRNWP